jgi:hypothetical protein
MKERGLVQPPKERWARMLQALMMAVVASDQEIQDTPLQPNQDITRELKFYIQPRPSASLGTARHQFKPYYNSEEEMC